MATSALLLISVMGKAQDVAFPWVRLGHDAASAGMADAGYMADENLAWSSFGSAAIVPLAPVKTSFAATYSMLQPSVNHYANVGLAFNVKEKVGISLGVSSGIGNKYPVYDGGGNHTGDFTPINLQAAFGLGFKLCSCLSLGFNARYAMQSVAEDNIFHAVNGDVMLACSVKGFRATAGVQALGADLGMAKAGDGVNSMKCMPTSAKLTLGYDDIIANESFRLAVYADGDYYFFNNSYSAAAGAAIGYKEYITFRGGYRYSSKMAPIPSCATVGIGTKFCGFSINAAYVVPCAVSGVLSNTFTAGIGYNF